jgi:protein involved in ribonucleotide reduction
MKTVKNGNVAKLSQNYMQMNKTGKEKMIKVAEQFLHIWNTIDRGKVILCENNQITETFKEGE